MSPIRMIMPDEALKKLQPELENIRMSHKPAELYDPIRYVLSMGGKRLRPVLALMTCSAYTEDFQKAIPAALAIEVFHNFTLLHDDIMDKAPLRRNKPTVHEKWNANIAILSGDAMLIKAYELLAQTKPSLLPAVLEVFSQTALGVCEGQQFDMNFESLQLVSEDAYLQMIELKTSVLLAASMKIGGICGESPSRDLDLLYEAGRCMGLAFQLQDDWLDSFGNTETFGKTIGGDIASNKKTWLYIKTLELASSADRKFLLETYSGNAHLDRDKKISEVTALFLKYQIDQLASEKVKYFSGLAMTALSKSTVNKQNLEIFEKLIADLTMRNA